MSPQRRDSNIVLVSIAVFVLFTVSSLWADSSSESAPDDGIDRAETAEAE